MTFDTYLVGYLENQGLWPDEARNVVDIMKVELHEMLHRWNDNVADYPDAALVLLVLNVREGAVDYLTEHKPRHFALAGLVP